MIDEEQNVITFRLRTQNQKLGTSTSDKLCLKLATIIPWDGCPLAPKLVRILLDKVSQEGTVKDLLTQSYREHRKPTYPRTVQRTGYQTDISDSDEEEGYKAPLTPRNRRPQTPYTSPHRGRTESPRRGRFDTPQPIFESPDPTWNAEDSSVNTTQHLQLPHPHSLAPAPANRPQSCNMRRTVASTK